jgi:hypothetical protein
LKCMPEKRGALRKSKEFPSGKLELNKKRAARQAALKLSQGSATFHS